MLVAIPLMAVGLILLRTAFAPEPDPRIVLRDLFVGRGFGISGGVPPASTPRLLRPPTARIDPADRKFFAAQPVPAQPQGRRTGVTQ